MYVKDLRATTDRDSLLSMFNRAREVGFNVDRLRITNMHLHIRTGVASTGRVPAGGLTDPAIGLAYLEMRGMRSDMTPAQAAASMVSLREHTRVSGSEAEVVSMAVRVEQRLSRTQARLRTMDVRQAALRVVRQLEASVPRLAEIRVYLVFRSSSKHGTSAREKKTSTCSKARTIFPRSRALKPATWDPCLTSIVIAALARAHADGTPAPR